MARVTYNTAELTKELGEDVPKGRALTAERAAAVGGWEEGTTGDFREPANDGILRACQIPL